jgi:hypothetical protein
VLVSSGLSRVVVGFVSSVGLVLSSDSCSDTGAGVPAQARGHDRSSGVAGTWFVSAPVVVDGFTAGGDPWHSPTGFSTVSSTGVRSGNGGFSPVAAGVPSVEDTTVRDRGASYRTLVVPSVDNDRFRPRFDRATVVTYR